MNKDIAIIGISGRFPEAKNIDALYTNLRNGKDSIISIPQKRLENTALPLDKKYKICGYLEEIDKFDHMFFGISLSEAINMSPVQRLLLETVYETIENAGYNVDDMDGSNTSVYAAGSSFNNYEQHIELPDSTFLTGNGQNFLSTKISRHFNLLGNSVVLDTACSSLITAIYLLSNELILEEAEMGIVCGANLDAYPTTEIDSSGLMSKSGKSKAFSSEAYGMSFGETVCAILLKRYDKALKDNDIIHAVIKGCAINNNGSKSSSMLAPDARQQALVITNAINKAGIRKQDIAFIEAHGSGTMLGDTLEIEGFNLALADDINKEIKIPISTIKSNIGHCMTAAGLVGIIKGVLMLKNRELVPNINCEKLNPHINFKDSSVYVNTILEELKPRSENGKLYIGVHSTGRGGVNGHIILEEYIDSLPQQPGERKEVFIPISSRTKIGLQSIIKNLYNFCELKTPSLENISFTLLKGRKHYSEYRAAFICDNYDTFKSELINLSTKDFTEEKDHKKDFYFIFSDQVISQEQLEKYNSDYPEFRKAYDNLSEYILTDNASIRSFAFQYCLYYLLENYSICTDKFISFGIGKIVKSVIQFKISIEEAVEEALNYKKQDPQNSYLFLKQFANNILNAPTDILVLGMRNEFSDILQSFSKENNILVLKIDEQYSFSELLKAMYLSRVDLNWSKVYGNFHGKKIELPTYVFEQTRCWPRDSPPIKSSMDSTKEKQTLIIKDYKNVIQYLIAGFFCNAIEIDELSIEDNFFELGGDSLKATKLINQLNNNFELDLDFEDVFDFPTVKELSSFLVNKLSVHQVLSIIWKRVLRCPVIKKEHNFFELGGHSLIANQIINYINSIYLIRLNFEDLFQNPTLGELGDLIELTLKDNNQSDSNNIIATEKKEYYPVSFSQKRMLLVNESDEYSSGFKVPIAFEIIGDISENKIKQIFHSLIQRHEILRTSFKFVDGQYRQFIKDTYHFDFDYSELNTEYKEAELPDQLKQIWKDFIRKFDVSVAPLMRAKLIKLYKGRHVLFLDIDHIINEKSTFNIFVRDFMCFLNGQSLPNIKIQYKDYVNWINLKINSQAFKKQEKYWLDIYKDNIPKLNLPTDFHRSDITNNEGDIINFHLDEQLTQKIKHFSREQNSTVFIFLLTSYGILLHKLSGQDDLIVGVPISNRDDELLENIAGTFLNALAVRLYPRAGYSFTEYFMESKNIIYNAYKNKDYPLDLLIEKLNIKKEMNKTLLFDTLFNSQSMTFTNEGTIENKSNISFNFLNFSDNKAEYDLLIKLIDRNNEIFFNLTYRKSVFNEKSINIITQGYKNIILQILDNPLEIISNYKIFNMDNNNNQAKILVRD